MDPVDGYLVLHVDDESDFADLTAKVLEREDGRFTVETATSAREGLEELASADYDCIVSDYQMPEQNGISFLETIREEYPRLPFVLYTGRGSEDVASEALSAGATDYLQKGSGTDQYELLANRITNAIDQYRASRRAANLDRIRTIRSEINQALLRSESRADAETRVCEIISESDPYLFAWIGETDSESERLNPRAWAGIEEGYLDEITVTADDTATGHGPGGTALRQRRVAVSQNVQEDPEFEPWREDALERGYQSLAAVPLGYDDRFYGGLGVYSERPHAFDEDERELLAELGSDIAHAIHSFEMQRELRVERKFVEEALNAIDDIFYLITPDGDLSRVNDRVSEVTGYTEDQLLSMEPTDFFIAADRERVEADIREALETGASSLEADLVTKDGETIPYEFSKRQLTDAEGNSIGVVGIGRDISERNERERNLKQQNERLDAFTRIVSHDLRNPLTVAAGGVELAQEECESDHLQRSERALDRMDALIEELLDLAREGEDVTEFVPVELMSVVEGCLATVETADTTRVDGVDRKICADESRLKQVVENLLSNTVDHGGEDVTVTVGTLDDGFYVEDDGPGIPERERDSVFEAGYSTSDEGSGFGLAIVKQVVTAHGWEICVMDGDEGGARFEITGVEFVAE